MPIRNSDSSDGRLQYESSDTDYFQKVSLPSTGSLTISDGEIHVWRVALEATNSVEAHLKQLLSADEQARLAGFRSSIDRQRFALRRGTLRMLLSAYTGLPGTELCFTQGKYGKPMLKQLPDRAVPCFNTSASDNLALIAVSGQLPLGIDIEFMRSIDEIHDIASRFFSGRERDSLAELPRDLQLDGFYRIWSSKEAIIKADGRGLSMPLDKFVVSSDPRHPPQLLQTTNDMDSPTELILYGLDPGKKFSGALATSRPSMVIRTWALNLNQMTRAAAIE